MSIHDVEVAEHKRLLELSGRIYDSLHPLTMAAMKVLIDDAYMRGQAETSEVLATLQNRIKNSDECELPNYNIDHDGNECTIRIKTVRKVLSGEWK